MTNTLDSLRRLPAVGALAERQMGGFLAVSALVGVGTGIGAAAMVVAVDWVTRQVLAILPSGDVSFWDPQRFLIFVTVPAGLLAAWWIARTFAC